MAKNKKRWQDLSTPEKASTIMMGVLQNALLIAALADIRRRPASMINGRKRVWTAVSFINFVGPIAYFLFGRKRGPAPA